MRTNTRGYVIAGIWIVVLNALLAWWIKGDLEMAWLIGMPAMIAGGFVIGAAPAIAFRRWKPALLSVGLSVAVSVVCLVLAIQTPHRWTSAPPEHLVAAASRFASDPTVIKAAVEKFTGYPVEPAIPAKVEMRHPRTTKEGFSFTLSRTPAIARALIGFDAGPADSVEFEASDPTAAWRILRTSGFERITVRPAAFARRFPNASLIEVGGSAPYSQGQSIAVRAARNESDWELVVFRLMEGDQVLREVRRYSSQELLSRFRETLAASHLGPLESVAIYFRPVTPHEVVFAAGPAFSFLTTLGNRQYWHAEIIARLADRGAMDFTVGRKLTRPRSPIASSTDVQ